MDYQRACDANLIQKFNPLPAYFEHLRTLINTDLIAENPQRFAVDSMYGAGRGVIKAFLQGTGCEISEVRAEMNPGFGGIHPEPIAKNLGALASAVSSGLGNFGLATDGDADRIGAMDERGVFVDPHKIMALSLKIPRGTTRTHGRGRPHRFHHAYDGPAGKEIWIGTL